MVRYQGANEIPGNDPPPDGVPPASDRQPVWPTILWTLIVIAVIVGMALIAG